MIYIQTKPGKQELFLDRETAAVLQNLICAARPQGSKSGQQSDGMHIIVHVYESGATTPLKDKP